MNKNRFAGLAAAKQLQEIRKQEESSNAKIVEGQTDEKSPQASQSNDSVNAELKQTRKIGRPNGKRSNAEFQQVTAYIRRDTYRKTSIKLLDRPSKGEFSELVEELLQKWLTKQH